MPTGKVLKAGWLSKKGGRIPTWHRRWFILKGDVLLYYRSGNDTKPLGTVTLPNNKVLRHGEDPKQPGCFKFEITSCHEHMSVSATHDTFLMFADSEKDMDSWIDAINCILYEPYGGGMFGRNIADTMAIETRLGGRYIPLMVHKCTQFIRKHGIKEIGIFRLPGQQTRITELRELFNQGVQFDFSDTEDVHTVASLLKLYFRELPEPLIEYSCYDAFSKATKSYQAQPAESLKEFYRLLHKLASSNYNLLKYLVRFLNDVQLESAFNKMTTNNLGLVFGPNLLRPSSEDPQMMMECASILTNFVVILISNHQELFPSNSDEKCPSRLSVLDIPANMLSGILSENSARIAGTLLPKTRLVERRPGSPTDPLQSTTNKVSSLNRMSTGNIALDGTNPIDGFYGVKSQRHPSSPELIFEEAEVKKGSKYVLARDPVTYDPVISPPQGKAMINSVSAEMLKLEREIADHKVSLAKAKKAARLWKRRYEAEKNARETAEFRVSELRQCLDETFQQFVIDEDEEDEEAIDGEEISQF